MKTEKNAILTINGGSSSIKFSLYTNAHPPVPVFYGQVANIGKAGATLQYTDAVAQQQHSIELQDANWQAAALFLLEWLQQQDAVHALQAIGHRIVHGMQHTKPARITPALIEDLNKISRYDPAHLPGEIKLVEMCTKHFPSVPQVACFDTSFHTSMPPVAKLLPIPRRFADAGIQRYGFHGLSYAYIMRQLAGIGGANGRIILLHLGSGASLAAVADGKSMDTSMGFTPASGIPMSTRTGDLDPGVAWYIMQSEHCSPEQFSQLINHESGLLGVSGSSGNMKELLKAQHTDSRAAGAVAFFCYQVKKWIGSFAAVLGGVDTLVFTGGIGEQSPEIRSRICSNLQFLGIELNETSNEENAPVISAGGGRVTVHVIQTNEELMIAEMAAQVLHETL